jgi:glutathione S-transferase
MLTLYHAPRSRSTRIVQLAIELGVLDELDLRITSIPRQDGSGGPDPANPNPDKKVPTLVHDGELIWETPAIILYLTDLFPEAGFAPAPGAPKRGTYLSWLSYYGDVVEPVIIFDRAQLVHEYLQTTFRSVHEVTARLEDALKAGPWLLGDKPSAADLLLSSPYTWFPDATPQVDVIRDWVGRCANLPSAQRAAEHDTEWLAG